MASLGSIVESCSAITMAAASGEVQTYFGQAAAAPACSTAVCLNYATFAVGLSFNESMARSC